MSDVAVLVVAGDVCARAAACRANRSKSVAALGRPNQRGGLVGFTIRGFIVPRVGECVRGLGRTDTDFGVDGCDGGVAHGRSDAVGTDGDDRREGGAVDRGVRIGVGSESVCGAWRIGGCTGRIAVAGGCADGISVLGGGAIALTVVAVVAVGAAGALLLVGSGLAGVVTVVGTVSLTSTGARVVCWLNIQAMVTLSEMPRVTTNNAISNITVRVRPRRASSTSSCASGEVWLAPVTTLETCPGSWGASAASASTAWSPIGVASESSRISLRVRSRSHRGAGMNAGAAPSSADGVTIRRRCS